MYEIRTLDVPAKGVAIWKNKTKLLEVLNVGATLNYLSLNGRGNIIDGYSSEELSSFAWSKSAILFPFPNRLRDGAYTFRGKNYQFPINDTNNHNALHGFVYAESFDWVDSEVTTDSCKLVFQYSYLGERNDYPFPFALTITYELFDERLNALFEVRNVGDVELPFGFGWHPYFIFDDDVSKIKMQLPEVDKILVDQRQLPTGQKAAYTDYEETRYIADERFDTGFHVKHENYSVILETSDQMQLEVQASNQPYLQVFTPEDRRRIAIEPMSSGIDVFNSKEGLQILPVGDSAIFSTSVKYNSL
jgi:aldose 1-epimerase